MVNFSESRISQIIEQALFEDIGYDATGRSTGNNELVEISKELSKFITHINKMEK
jgi:type I restriction enzyme M protein